MPGKVYLTGSRALQRDNLLIAARKKNISWELYHKDVAKLEKQQVKVNEKLLAKKEAAKIKAAEEKKKEKEAFDKAYEAAKEALRKREEERKKKAEEKKKKAEEKKQTKKIDASELISKIIASGDGEIIVRDIWKLMQNINEARLIVVGKDNFHDRLIRFGDYKKKFRMQFLEGNKSDGHFIFENTDTLLLVKPSDIKAVKLVQRFRDGVAHCVFSPILAKLNEKLEESSSDATKKRYKQRIAKLIQLQNEYEDGVPEDKMEEVAKASGLVIQMNNIVGEKLQCWNENGKLAKLFLTNTRENHLDEGSIVKDKEFEEISGYEMDRLWVQAKRGKLGFYQVEGDLKNDMPSKLLLLNKSYKVANEEADIMNEFSCKVGLSKYKLNATKYPEVNEFIKQGRIINSWATSLSDGDPSGHIDMPKAYAQFKKCEWYNGFLGVIHQWGSGNFGRTFLEEHIGIYQFRVLDCKNELFQRLGIFDGSVHILPSPEILYFMDKGVKVEVVCGVWGSRFDFEFEDKMLENRRYCLWSGRLSCEQTEKAYTFPGSSDFASHLKATLNSEVLYWKDKGLITVKQPVKTVFTAHHILAGITSYVRIQMMEAMSKFDVDNIIKVVLDGIYFKGDKPDGLDWFVEKELKQHYALNHWYDGIVGEFHFPKVLYERNTVIAGQGGAGKTYGLMTHSGFNDILYVAPQHVLGQNVRNKWEVNYTTIHQLIGVDCEPYHIKYGTPKVIIVDELTQIEASWIDKVFEMYNESLIFILGDINKDGMWFQTRNGKPGEFSKIWKPVDVDFVVVEGDRRSRDDKLKKLKVVVREVMERVFINGDSGEQFDVLGWIKKNLKIHSFDDAVKMFEKGDTWIAGTHKTNQKLLENGVVSGWYKKGGYIRSQEEEGFEKRGAFTIHSYQGSTIESGKIFISVDDLFEFTMFYTAISRAVHFSQIVLVGK